MRALEKKRNKPRERECEGVESGVEGERERRVRRKRPRN